MRVNGSKFIRNFARMKALASKGEKIVVVSRDEEFVFELTKRRTWQGALKGKVRIVGDILSTGIEWEASKGIIVHSTKP